MFKPLAAAIIVLAGASLASTAGQGRGQGGPPAGVGGGAGAGGAHSTMGMPSGSQRPATAGAPSGASSGRGATNTAGSAPLGPKSPASLLQQNTKLASNLAAFFPEGTDLMAQAGGFKNLGAFVSAVHVSHNLGIPFADLKCAELGTTAATASGAVCSPAVTNEKGTSLGQAIQTLKPDANSQQAIQEANRQAEKDLKDARP